MPARFPFILLALLPAAQNLLDCVDLNSNGVIDYEEFLAATMHQVRSRAGRSTVVDVAMRPHPCPDPLTHSLTHSHAYPRPHQTLTHTLNHTLNPEFSRRCTWRSRS